MTMKIFNLQITPLATRRDESVELKKRSFNRYFAPKNMPSGMRHACKRLLGRHR